MRGKEWLGANRSLVLGSLKIATTYCVVACLWILLSDEILRALVTSVELFAQISLYKGWFFVVATAAMLFHLVHRFGRTLDRERSEILASACRQALILNSVPGAIFIKDTSHRYTFANEEACKLLGVTLDELCGKTDDELLSEERGASVRAEESALLSSGGDLSREGQSDFPNAEPDRVYLIRKIALFDNEGNVTGICGLATEVTEHAVQARAMAESEARLQLALSATRSAVWEIDTESRVVIRSGKFEEFFGVPQGRGYVQEFWSRVHPDDLDIVSSGLEKAIQTGEPLFDQFRFYKDGDLRWLRRRARRMDRLGRSPVLIGTVTDVTDIVRLQEAAEANAKRRDVLFRNAIDGIVILDKDGRVVEANESFALMLGTTPEKAAEMSVFDWDSDVRDEDLAMIRFAPKRRRSLARWTRADGAKIEVEVDAVSTTVGGEELIMCHCRDVTEKLRSQERIRRLALYDELTGLPNRHAFLQQLDDQIAAEAPFGVILLDIDRFRTINDNYGHPFGDDIVCQVAQRLDSICGGEPFVARLGGDDFALIVSNRYPLETVVDAISATFADPIEARGVQMSIDVSVGTCLFPEHAVDQAGIMRCLDISQHEAKSRGRGSVAHYDPELGQRQRARHDMEVALHRAVEEEQFVLFYQPIINLTDDSVIGCEALVRWEHPEVGLVSPDVFIGLAEDTNQIIPLGKWILRTACQQGRAWSDRSGTPLKMSVNVSSKQFSSPSLVEDVAAALAESGLQPGLLQIEITESLLMDDPVEAVDTLKRLKALGVALAIDDFGTGYSSLGFLNRYPVDCLKVDRSFVSDALHDMSSATICRTIVSLAHSLGLSVVAEGVEEDGQARFLRSLGCEMTQGYLYSRPVPAEAFERFVTGGESKAA